MPAPKGNQYAVGNRGGYRKGYEWEEGQKQEMRKNLNWLFAYIKAVRTGKATERQHTTFQRLERILIKMMDKLHANKNQTDLTTDGEPLQQLLVQFIDGNKTNNNGDTSGVSKAV